MEDVYDLVKTLDEYSLVLSLAIRDNNWKLVSDTVENMETYAQNLRELWDMD